MDRREALRAGLPPDEAERLFADYERRNRLIAPIIRAVLSRLLGWRYDSTPPPAGGRSNSSRSWASGRGNRSDVAPPSDAVHGAVRHDTTLGWSNTWTMACRAILLDHENPYAKGDEFHHEGH